MVSVIHKIHRSVSPAFFSNRPLLASRRKKRARKGKGRVKNVWMEEWMTTDKYKVSVEGRRDGQGGGAQGNSMPCYRDMSGASRFNTLRI